MSGRAEFSQSVGRSVCVSFLASAVGGLLAFATISGAFGQASEECLVRAKAVRALIVSDEPSQQEFRDRVAKAEELCRTGKTEEGRKDTGLGRTRSASRRREAVGSLCHSKQRVGERRPLANPESRGAEWLIDGGAIWPGTQPPSLRPRCAARRCCRSPAPARSSGCPYRPSA
jgi:hypothetical protein